MRTAQKVTYLYGFWAAILVSGMTAVWAIFTQRRLQEEFSAELANMKPFNVPSYRGTTH